MKRILYISIMLFLVLGLVSCKTLYQETTATHDMIINDQDLKRNPPSNSKKDEESNTSTTSNKAEENTQNVGSSNDTENVGKLESPDSNKNEEKTEVPILTPDSGTSTPKEPDKTQEPFQIEDLSEEAMTLKANFASGKESEPLLISKADKAAIINLLNAAEWKPDTLKLATDLHLYIGKSKYYFDPYEGHLHVTLRTGGHHTTLNPESTLQLNAILTPYLENNLEILTDLKHNGRFWLLEEDVNALKALFAKYPEEEITQRSYEHQFSIDGINYQYHRDSGSILIQEKATGFILNETDRLTLNTLLDKYPKFSS